MKPRRLLFCLIICAVTSGTYAQDQANFTQFYLNPYILNPSYAGIDGKTSVSLIYRRQWLNLDGGPSIANFSLHTPINPKTSTGLSVTNDSRGLLNHTSLLFSFGYNLELEKNSHLRFGISAGGSWNTVDMNKLQGFNDQALGALSSSHASLAGNAGISYHSKTFHIGMSLPYIFEPPATSTETFEVSAIKPFENSIFHASNRFYFQDNKFVFEPYVIYRLSSTVPSQLEAAALLHMNHVVYLGGSYKQDFGISALGGIKLKNMLAIGMSYSISNSGANELNSPTFEISLNYLLGAHKKGTMVYSFVDTHVPKVRRKPSPAEVARKHAAEEAARKKALDEAAKKKEAEDLARHQEEIKKLEEARKHEVVTPPKEPPAHNPRFSQEMNTNVIVEGHHEHEQEQLKRLEIHQEDATDHHNEEGHPHAERHEFVKVGSHEKELDVSDYVIGGVFRSEANAKHFSEGLDLLGFDTHYGHLTEKNLWYVYVIKTTDINAARAERDRVRKMKILKDAWLLTVHN